MISIVCVYNNKKKLDEFLLKSLKNQNTDYELILLDNTKNKFSSAAEALNFGGKKANSKYIMFVHQDVDLSSESFLKDVELLLDSLDKPGVVGVVGVESIGTMIKNKSIRGVLGNMDHDNPPRPVSRHHINKVIKAQTVDECLFIIPKNLFDQLNFDEISCHDWHLYATDFSLSSKKLGYNTYIIPSYIYHLSPGYSLSEEYYNTLKLLLKKHKTLFFIRTVFGNYNTIIPLYIQRKLNPYFYKIFKLIHFQ